MATLLAEPFEVAGVIVQPVLAGQRDTVQYTPVGVTGFKGSGKNEVVKRFVAAGWQVGSFAMALREEVFGIVHNWVKPSKERRELAAKAVRKDWFLYNYDKEFAQFIAFIEEHKRDPLNSTHGWVRQYLQAHGAMRRSTVDEDYWVRQLTITPITVIDDLRFINEGKSIYASRGRTIRVIRPGYDSDGAPSEEEIPRIPVDYTIYNDGSLVDLWQEADRIVSDVLKRGPRGIER